MTLIALINIPKTSTIMPLKVFEQTFKEKFTFITQTTFEMIYLILYDNDFESPWKNILKTPRVKNILKKI